MTFSLIFLLVTALMLAFIVVHETGHYLAGRLPASPHAT